jgi:hypothetical protein
MKPDMLDSLRSWLRAQGHIGQGELAAKVLAGG